MVQPILHTCEVISMGGRGNAAERNHKAYLENGNFRNLDEFDEEVLRDAQLRRAQSEQATVKYTPQQIQGVIRQANNALKSEDEDKLGEVSNRLNTILRNGSITEKQRADIRDRLLQVNNALDRIDYEIRRSMR